MELDFYVHETVDSDSGIHEYIAYLTKDLDENGIPKPDAFRRNGETPWEAIARLCYLLYDDDVDWAHWQD